MNPGKELRPDDIKDLIKLPCGLYGKLSNDWYLRHFRGETYGKGDIIYTNCRNLLENEEAYMDMHYDAFYEAHRILDHIYLLLYLGIRWPIELNDDNDAKNWLSYQWSFLIFKSKYDENNPEPWPRKYRTRTGMTRDCYIYFFAACVEFDRMNFIKWTKIPVFCEFRMLFRLKTWLWRRALITQKRSKLYEWLETSQDHKLDYAKLLKHYRMRAYEKRVLNDTI